MSTPKFNFGKQKDAAELSSEAKSGQAKANQASESAVNTGKSTSVEPASTGNVTNPGSLLTPNAPIGSEGSKDVGVAPGETVTVTGTEFAATPKTSLKAELDKAAKDTKRTGTEKEAGLPEVKAAQREDTQQERGGTVKNTLEPGLKESTSTQHPEVEIIDPPPGNPRVSGASDIFSPQSDKGRIPGPQPIVGVGVIKEPFAMMGLGLNPQQKPEETNEDDFIASAVPFVGQIRQDGEKKFRVQLENEPPHEVFAKDRLEAQFRYAALMGIISTTNSYTFKQLD